MDISMQLPEVILKSDDFSSLEKSQQESFVRRIVGIRAVGQRLAIGFSTKDENALFQEIQDIELDASILQEFDGAHRGGVSRWLIHNSWSFSIEEDQMMKMGDGSRDMIDTQSPKFGAPVEEFYEWLEGCGLRLVDCVDQIWSAKAYSNAVVSLIALDILFADLLVACYKFKFASKGSVKRTV